MNIPVLMRYLSALFFYLMLAFGSYIHWWTPTYLETALEAGLAALGIFHSVNYAALNLTGAPQAPAAMPQTPQAPTESTVTTSTQGDTHAA